MRRCAERLGEEVAMSWYAGQGGCGGQQLTRRPAVVTGFGAREGLNLFRDRRISGKP